jgi:hypothetical protein
VVGGERKTKFYEKECIKNVERRLASSAQQPSQIIWVIPLDTGRGGLFYVHLCWALGFRNKEGAAFHVCLFVYLF